MIKAINIGILLFLFNSANGQAPEAKCKIATIGRYNNSKMEIRWIPNVKSVLELGINSSYKIERADSGKNNFINLTEIKSLAKLQWDSMISVEKDENIKNSLEIAAEFVFKNNQQTKSSINLESGIADLRDKKSKEDFEYIIFVMSVISDAKVAYAMGLGFVDKSAIPNSKYTYRITLNTKSKLYNTEPGLINVTAIENNSIYKNKVFVYPGDKFLSFAWEKTPELSGYFVERADPNSFNYKPLNTIPFYASSANGYQGKINGTYFDDSLVNYNVYKYRFYGKNSFGEKVLFAEVEGMPKDMTPPSAPIISQPKHLKQKEVKVRWDIYGELKDLNGFIVARSNKDSGNFEVLHKKLIPKNLREITDTSFKLNKNNYYKVYALDTAGNISVSYTGYVALIDSIPPTKPEILKAVIDSNGVVKLTIKKGKEEDLKGYQIYSSNSSEHEFSVIEEAYKEDSEDSTPIKLEITDTVTLHSLTPKIYYRIQALDFNYNHSMFSEIVEVKRPDTIPPVIPVFQNIVVYSNQIQLGFAPSSSKDVIKHILYRKTELTEDWLVYATLDSISKSYMDTSVKQGIMYYYALRAQDDSKLFSGYSQIVKGKPYDNGVRPPIENLKGEKVKEGIKISWTYPILQSEIVKYEVYKLDSNGKLKLLDVISDRFYIDTKIQANNTYQIRVVTNDGGQSKLSTKLVVADK